MIHRNRRIYTFKMRINTTEKRMIQELVDDGEYKSASEFVRTLIKQKYDERKEYWG